LGLRDRIVFLGPQEDVAPPLASADVFLLPSETESFGLSALEALACGVPVVGSRVGGLPEVVDDGGSGFLHPVGDFESMAASVIRLVENRETWAAFSARARRRAVESFAASRIIDTYEQRLVSVTREEAAKTA
jgi:glycosyltransferase involved in cell wall biosynthesis